MDTEHSQHTVLGRFNKKENHQNPGDMTSRVTDALNLSSKLWKEGPVFLKCPFEEWSVKTM